MDTTFSMPEPEPSDLTALLGSRICHDLISPIGAIGNGVELLAMAGLPQTPEIALIADSVRNANARIRFFRVAFGMAGNGPAAAAGVSRAEVLNILSEMSRGGRIRHEWQGPAETPRDMAKLAFLAILCMESALSWGGTIRVAADGSQWSILAEADRLRIDEPLWQRLSDGMTTHRGLAAAQIQFALLPAEARRAGRQVDLLRTATRITIRL